MKRVSAAVPAIVLASSILWLSGCENGASSSNSTVQPTTAKAETKSTPTPAPAPDVASKEVPVNTLASSTKINTTQPDAVKIKPAGVTAGGRGKVDDVIAKSAAANADRIRSKMGGDKLAKSGKVDNSQFVNDSAPVTVHAVPAAVDLGEISTSDVGTGSVKLVNDGDKPMRLVECKSSCGCTTTNCPKGQVIPAHDSIELEIRLTAGATPNDHISKSLTYIVEDHPMITVPVTAKVVSYITVDPPYFDTDKSLDGHLTLRSIDNQPFVVTSMIPAIIDDLSETPAAVQELNIDWDRWVDSGHRGRITIYTDHPKCRAVYAQVRGVKATEAQKKWAENRPSAQQNPGISPTVTSAASGNAVNSLGTQFQPQVVTLSPVDARLHANTKIENIDEMTKAIDEGANVDAADASGKTPLHIAAANGKYAAMNLLLDKGADIEARDRSGRTPLMWSVESRNAKMPLLLIERGAKIDDRDETGGTPLMWAAGFGDSTTLKAILDAGADLAAADDHGMTPLMWAASFGDGERVKMLLNAGMKVDIVDATRGCSALMYASRSSGSVETIKALVDAGANLNLVDVTGRTALAWAALLGTPEKVQLLLDSGSDVTKEDFRGWTPLTYAKNRRDRSGPQITAILEDATAKAAAAGGDKSASTTPAPIDPQARR